MKRKSVAGNPEEGVYSFRKKARSDSSMLDHASSLKRHDSNSAMNSIASPYSLSATTPSTGGSSSFSHGSRKHPSSRGTTFDSSTSVDLLLAADTIPQEDLLRENDDVVDEHLDVVYEVKRNPFLSRYEDEISKRSVFFSLFHYVMDAVARHLSKSLPSTRAHTQNRLNAFIDAKVADVTTKKSTLSSKSRSKSASHA